MQKMKLDGYEKGVYDLCIIVADNDKSTTWLIEFKWNKGKLTKEQAIIWNKAKGVKGINAVVIRDIGCFINLVEKEFK